MKFDRLFKLMPCTNRQSAESNRIDHGLGDQCVHMRVILTDGDVKMQTRFECTGYADPEEARYQMALPARVDALKTPMGLFMLVMKMGMEPVPPTTKRQAYEWMINILSEDGTNPLGAAEGSVFATLLKTKWGEF